ncbi:hypothetical protein HOY80DRAFT_1140366 [Tuber brumale]|nr:hypothetical protein HOY80DRAFT_1140366 [Tuber brumale]
MFRLITNLAIKTASNVHPASHLHVARRSISTAHILQRKRLAGPKYQTSYSNVTFEEAEKRLGFVVDMLNNDAIDLDQMLAEMELEIDGLGREEVWETKQKVYDRILEFVEMEGYPNESTEEFKEANVNDLVYAIITPIVTDFKRKTGRNLRLQREKEIVASDAVTGGYQEFVMLDMIGVGNRKFVFVVEAKKSSLGGAKRQCLLSMKDMGDRNGGGVVYGFVTTGEQWQMLRYGGAVFSQTDNFQVVFHSMRRRKERWMEHCSIVVDCIHMALRSGGFVAT